MVRTACRLLAFAVIVAVLRIPAGSAQTADSTPPDPLPGFPKVSEAPASLFAPPARVPVSNSTPKAYFESDPRLDRPELPPLGWFVNADVSLSYAHVKNRLTDTVQIGNNAPNTVQVGSSNLDWTVSPRFEAGYRLPSGFGDLSLSYRFLASSGSGLAASPDGVENVNSRLDINVFDFDYTSREWSLWPCWDMKWWFGVRLASIFFDSHAGEPYDVAAAGSGIFASGDSNRYVGAGPHLGLELARRLDEYGLSLVGRIDGWMSLGRIRQSFHESSTTLDANGVPLYGQTVATGSQEVSSLNVELGINWTPPSWPNVSLFAGYQYEYWWNAGRLSSTPDSRGELSDQGFLLRAEISF